LRGKGIAQYTSDPVFRAQLAQPLNAPAPKRSVNLSSIGVLIDLLRSYPGNWRANLRSGEPMRAVARFVATYSRPSLTWNDLAFLRQNTTLPILLKGILSADDAQQALDHQMDGVIVSNHGGRQVDGAIGALDALPKVVAAVGGKIPVLFDSGIRGGADVFKALALGARGVSIGRPYAYGLAIAGAAGVQDVIRNIRADFDLTMGLAGCTRIADITADRLVRVDPAL
jgi:lactate 2-monooxygenase